LRFKGICPPKLFSATLRKKNKLIKIWYGSEYDLEKFEKDLIQLCQQLKIPYPFD